MEKIFEQKAAIVTGGSFGIGCATAIAFAQHGAQATSGALIMIQT